MERVLDPEWEGEGSCAQCMVRRVINTLSLIHRVFNHPNIWKRDDFLCVSGLHMCNNQFTHSLDMVPKGRLGLSLCAGPPVTGSTSDRGIVYGGSMVDIAAKESSPLS